jgi:hypothetical protein
MTQDDVHEPRHRWSYTGDNGDNGLCHCDGGNMLPANVMPSMDLVSRAILPHGVKTVVTRDEIGYHRPMGNVPHHALHEDCMRRRSP